jgi:hypothetical protein
LTGALWMFWRTAGAFSEDRGWLEKALVGGRGRERLRHALLSHQRGVTVGHSPLALRAERRALGELAQEISGRYGRTLELRVLQYGVTKERLQEVLEEE